MLLLPCAELLEVMSQAHALLLAVSPQPTPDKVAVGKAAACQAAAVPAAAVLPAAGRPAIPWQLLSGLAEVHVKAAEHTVLLALLRAAEPATGAAVGEDAGAAAAENKEHLLYEPLPQARTKTGVFVWCMCVRGGAGGVVSVCRVTWQQLLPVKRMRLRMPCATNQAHSHPA